MDFQYFWLTKETIPPGLEWNHYCPWHLLWLAGLAAFATLLSRAYKRKDAPTRARWRRALGVIILVSKTKKREDVAQQ